MNEPVWILEMNIGKGWVQLPWPALESSTGILGVYIIASRERTMALKHKLKAKAVLEEFYQHPVRIRAAKYVRVWPAQGSDDE